MVQAVDSSESIDFFISYSPANVRWATWIAWELEAEGHRTMLQAWDFVPGTDFVDFMDRGVSGAKVTVAVLSDAYLRSRYGRLEWHTALRQNPDRAESRLVPVRVEACAVEGLLATITYVDLVGVADPAQARRLLLERIRDTVVGRAKPAKQPSYPADFGHLRAPEAAPAYPALAGDNRPRDMLSILQVRSPRFGESSLSQAGLQERILTDLAALGRVGESLPELAVVSGDLTATGSLKESQEALSFLLGLRSLLGLEPQRVIVVPGPRDVNLAASRAYFSSCEADDVTPDPPYWPKWRHFANLFRDLYHGLDHLYFDATQPWTLFPIPELRIVVAGLNSTMALSHREEDQHGWIGQSQLGWFAEALRRYQRDGWLRIGLTAYGPAQLRDAAEFDAELGRTMNLLVDGGMSAGVERLASGLLRVGGLDKGACRMLEVATQDLRLLVPAAEEVSREVTWDSVSTTFPTLSGSGGITSNVQPLEETADADLPPSPAEQLLSRIREVCEIKYPRAGLRVERGELPSLLVSDHEGDVMRQFRIAALVGMPTDEALERLRGMTYSSGVDAELVYDGQAPPSMAIQERALRMNIKVSSFLEFQSLLDLDEYIARQSERLASSVQYAPSLYVPQRFTEAGEIGSGPRMDLIGELLGMVRADSSRLALILGDFGHGKTFALRELARRIPLELPHLIPIFIELRQLDKSHSVEGLVAAHLADHGQDRLDVERFRYLLREGRIVLLFDGFDELVARVTYERATEHLERLLAAIQGKSKIVISGRTQFFRTGDQVRAALTRWASGRTRWRMLELESFQDEQIENYLTNQYGGDRLRARARRQLLEGVPGLLSLAHNPRMLTFISSMEDDRLRLVAHGRNPITHAGLYREVLTSWLTHEERRTHAPGAPAMLTVDDLWHAVTVLAKSLWGDDEAYIRLEKLTEITATTLTQLADGHLSADEAAHAVGTGTLLVRTEEGLFGFIHNSVVEWLVANDIATQWANGIQSPPQLSQRTLTDLAVQFLGDLAGHTACQEWCERIISDSRGTDQRARANALRLGLYLRSPQRKNLAGAYLVHENLSGREFQEVDFTGADLSQSNLTRTNLTRATLRRAALREANLEYTYLREADLREANLSRAWLARADLRGVRYRGSVWNRATLIDCQIDDEMATSAELRPAALVSDTRREHVKVEVSPTEVGVPYGFSGARGRLAEPLSYGPDGDLLAVGNDDGSVFICDGTSGLPLRTLRGHIGRVYGVVFASGGPLVTGAADGHVRFWDAATGDESHVLPKHSDWAWPIVVSQDGASLLTADSTGVAWLWDIQTGERLQSLPGHEPPVFTAAFTPDGRHVVTGDSSGAVSVWETATGRRLHRLGGGQRGPVFRAVFAPTDAGDRAMLATGDGAGVIRLWDPISNELLLTLDGHLDGIYSLAYSPDGRWLASGATDRQLRLWDTRTGACVRNLPEHGGGVYWVAFSPDGSMLASCDSVGGLRLWDPESGHMIRDLTGHLGAVWPFEFHPRGATLATSGDDKTVRLWDITGQSNTRVLRGHGRKVRRAYFDASGNRVISCGLDGHARIWNPRSGVQERNLSSTAYALLDAASSQDGQYLATVTSDGRVCLWNAETGLVEREIDVDTDNVWALAFRPGSDLLATANDDDTVRVWNWKTGREFLVLGGHLGRVRSLGFTSDGDMLATGCDDRTVRLWDLSGPHFNDPVSRSLDGHSNRVYQTQFGPDDSVLLSAGHDGTARLWDVNSGKLLTTFSHGARIWTASFGPRGDMIATAGEDAVIRLWDSSSGGLAYSLTGHSKRITSVAFSADGNSLVSGADDGLVMLWDVSAGMVPQQRLTMLGLPEGWVAFAPDGRYKYDGEIAEQFWHAVGTCRFDPGVLDHYVQAIRRLGAQESF